MYSEFVTDVKRRSYNSPLRTAQAARTRARIGTAAAAEFAEHGWGGTTVAAIAERAGITPQAVHLAVGGKAALLVRAVETAVAGDPDDVFLADRPAFADVYDSDVSAARRIRAFAAVTSDIYDRAARLFLVLQEAAQSDAEVARLAAEGGERRLVNHRRLAELLIPAATAGDLDELADVIWVLAAPGVYVDFVHRRGWPSDRYSRFLAEAIRAAVNRARRRPG